MQTRSRARVELLGAAALFSTGGAAIKACELTGWQVGGLRSFIAVFAFLFFVREARRRPVARELLVGAAYAGCLVSFVLANKLTTAADAIFLQAAAPLYLLFLSPLLLGERPSRRDVLLLGVLGLGIACFFADELTGGAGQAAQATAPDPWLGRWVGLGSGFLWALTVLGLRWLASKEQGTGGASAVVWGNAIAALACAPFALPMSTPDTGDLLVLVYLGVFQIALAYRFVTRALREVPVFEAAVLLLVEPVFNPLWAWLVHGERPTAWALLGGAIILAGTLVKTWIESRRR